MGKILFVCYLWGTRGEFLSHRISQHTFFKTLEARKINGRTIIDSDYYGKRFLMGEYAQCRDIIPPSHNIVVPSHYFYEDLIKDFPYASFVSIRPPKNLDSFHKSLYERYYNYRTTNLLELVGECEDVYKRRFPTASESRVKDFVISILKTKQVTFGDISCLIEGLKPTKHNKEKLMLEYRPKPLSKETIQNSLIIPYEKVETFPVESVIDYVQDPSKKQIDNRGSDA